MERKESFFKKTFKKTWVKVLIGIVVLIVIISLFSGGKDGDDVTAVAQKKNIAETVSVTGKVKSGSDVSLAFERSGRVRQVYVDVGNRVNVGDTLVSLENTDLAADLAQAQAKVKAEQAKLDELEKGSSAEDIAVSARQLESAKIALADAKRLAVDTLQDAYTKTDDVLFNKADQFYTNANTSSPIFNLTADSQMKSDLQNSRVIAGSFHTAWNTKLKTISAEGDLDSQFIEAKKNLDNMKKFIDLLAQAINSLSSSSSLSQSTIDSYKSSVSSARTTIGTEIAEVTTSEKSVRGGSADVALEESRYDQKRSPARPEAVRAQEAVVESANASVLGAQAQIGKSVLRSPIAGVVTIRNVEPGEIIGANSPLITVISTNLYKMEANIPESDVAAVKIGNDADVTLDAYNGIHFKAKVVSVDPAETIIEGVPTYRAVFAFSEQDERIKSGMTANIDVVVNEIKDVITVPARAVTDTDGKKTVKVQDGDSSREVTVVVGIKDSEGNIEIKEGLAEGDVVLLPTVAK